MKNSCLVVLVSLFTVASCVSYKVRPLLADIETYIAERPDSALSVLESIRTDDLASKRDRAHYALLYVMALDKNYIDISDDSLARVAVDYYSQKGPEKYKARSYYYLGIAYYYQKEYAKAILEFTKAEQSASLSDSLYLGMALQAQADTYSHTYNDAEELKCLNRALSVFENIGEDYYRSVVQFSLARLYANIDEYDKAEAICRELMANADDFPHMKADILANWAFMKMKSSAPDYKEALELYDELENMYDFKGMSYKDYWSWSYALRLSGNKSKSERLVDMLSEIDSSVTASYWKYRLCRSDNDYQNALFFLEKNARQHNATIDSILTQSLSSAQRDYFRSQSEIADYKLMIRNMWILVILSVSFMTFVVVYVVVRRRVRIEREEKEKVLAYIEEINRQFNVSIQNDQQSLKMKFISLYKSRFETLGILCNQYFAHDGYEGAEKLMYKRVWSLIEDIRNDKVRREKFEKLLDDELDGIMTNIRTEMPKLKEIDYTLFSYIIAGFDMSAISRLLDMSLNNVYAHKRRLRIKIEKRNPIHSLQYLEMMS